ncbi:ABC transporter substrate-binding protein [Clostridium sp.]|uniref:ABC transporter substrate-binding protein n=1 Tax=Clostridium sp. TaxID=1506 RepID=UPI0029014012|nr:ABC transporter substrate-binding protein [Clostridium sp.]MDU2158012.1 ABC transporter substrate-binding protein [Clostridium sp.]
MKIRRKLSIYLIIIIFTVLLVNTLVTNTNDHIIKGNINIWVEDKYYSYFTSTAKEFEKNNKKVSIKVVSVKQEDYLYKILNTVPNELPSIVHLNFKELNSVIDKIEFTNENKQIIETYNKNFNNSRLEEVQIKDNYYAVPFTSNPIALYLRSDILKKFGYKAEDINSWERLIEIGKDIYTKSNGDINIFSSQDKENIRLLLAAQLVDYEEKSYENNQINDIINSIYNESFINDSNYICRIASIDFYKDLINNSIDGIWECKNPPSLNIGENKFYDIGGENLVALNIENNKEAIKSFISYASTNKELLSKEMLECNFVPSSLYSLRTKNINKEGTKVQGSIPFLILSNIVEKAPEIKSYDKFNEIIYNVYN